MGVALLALFVALGGTSYAAVSLAVPANSIDTPQIRNDSVTRGGHSHHTLRLRRTRIRRGQLVELDRG
jgi:hypothetical protein